MKSSRLLTLSSVAALGLLLAGCGGGRPAALPASMSLDLGDGVALDLIRVGEGKGAYCLGKYEVTQAQYEAVMGWNPSSYGKADRADHPVEEVSWDNAMAFCEELNERHGKLLPRGYVFTLPTEAQWEKAAYAGRTTAYSGGDALGAVGWYEWNSDGHSHAAGGKKANAWGFHDMSGNVTEWCLDVRAGTCRALRGGSWKDSDDGCRVDRCCCAAPGNSSSVPGFHLGDRGFRVVASRPSK